MRDDQGDRIARHWCPPIRQRLDDETRIDKPPPELPDASGIEKPSQPSAPSFSATSPLCGSAPPLGQGQPLLACAEFLWHSGHAPH